MRWLILLLVAGCTSMVQPIAPVGFTPGPAQHTAAAHVTACSGRTVHATDVRWWAVEGIEGHPDALGAWNPPGDIYLTRSAMEDTVIVGHELLHHVLDGDSRHRSPLWVSCGLTEASLE
jgi:hypothetical protein